MEDESNKAKLFWQNLNSRQKKVFVIGGVVIAALLVIGFVASMDMMKKTDNEITENSSDEVTGNDEGDTTEVEDYVDPTITPIEGGDVNNIDTYLPHEKRVEIAPELTERGILGFDYSIQVDKDNKIITAYIYNIDDEKAKAEAEAYLATIPAEVLEGYEIKVMPYYSDDE